MLSAGLVAAVAAVTLSGCGIRSTAVPVDAGIPASRTACPPTPGAAGAASDSTGPAVLTTAAPSYLLPGVPTDLPSQSASETPWEALASALPVPPGAPASSAAKGASGAASTRGPGASGTGTAGSGRATRGSAVPTAGSPTASTSSSSRSSSTGSSSSRSPSSGFSLNDCPGVTGSTP